MKYWAALILIGTTGSWIHWWFTPDQQGQRLMNREEFEAAAEEFHDPMWIGVAWYRAGDFNQAEQMFARLTKPEAEFNRGNCLVMQGNYQAAIDRYDRALELRPDWSSAITNREIARARADRVNNQGGEMGDQRIGADEIVFDKDQKNQGQDTEIDQSQPMSQADMQAMWLRRVQTKPADFLKSKFAYQTSEEDS